MTRKIMLGLSGVAAVTIVTFAITGWPPLFGGVEGDVTQAKRYQAQQLAAKDVVLGDTVAHRFFQSETFDRLVKDDAARQLLGSANFRVLLADPRALAAVQNPTLRHALDDPALRTALNDPKVAKILATPAVQAAFAHPDFKVALYDTHFAWAMARTPKPCEDWGCGSNSPAIQAAILARVSLQ